MQTMLVPNFLNNFCCADIFDFNANKRMWQWQSVETVVLARHYSTAYLSKLLSKGRGGGGFNPCPSVFRALFMDLYIWAK